MDKKISKSLVGKLGIAAAVGLIGSNLLTPLSYPVFAQDAWNTATYSSSDDGYTVTYDGKSYTVALSDQTGTYKWGNNTAGDSTTYAGSQYNNQWGGSGDNASNGYNPNPTNYDERQGPCDDGYHVPSRGEWNAIVTAWCHLDTNTCTESDLQHASDWISENGLIYVSKSGLGSDFKTKFGMSGGFYWSSSPVPDSAYSAWYLFVNDSSVTPSNSNNRGSDNRVRCVKNSTSAGGSSSEQSSSSSSSALTWADVESGSLAETLVNKLFSFIMPEQNVYLYAIAEPNTYYVAYSGNQATSGTMENSTFTYDTAGTLRANAFERAGYTFSGWNTQADNSGTGYADGASVLNLTAVENAVVNMFAQWNANLNTKYYVDHYLQDLTGDYSILTGTTEQTGITDDRTNATPNSYVGFTTNVIGSGDISGNEDTHVSITYNRNTYNGTLASSVTGITTSSAVGANSEGTNFKYEDTITLSATTGAGYTFASWTVKDSSENDVTVTNPDSMNGATFTMPASAVTITPSVTVNEYTITYTLHNGTADPANPTTYTVESEAITLNNPTRDNSVFAGWSGTDIDGLSNEVTIANGSLGNRTYEANWSCAPGYHDGGSDNCEANTYSGSVVYNDGTHGSAESIVFTYDQYTTLPNPSQSGYDFAGWTITGMSGGVEHYIGETTTTESAYSGAMATQFKNLTTDEGYTDITFTAKWTPKTDTKYVVNYYVKDLGADTYTLRETYTGSATTDTDIVFSTEQARYSFTGFNYSGGYENEGDTTRPEGLGATTGNVDKYGTTVINLYYDRINSTVSLNGDHITSFSGAGNYEYGAEVTVDATVATGYHFVRWERRNSDWTKITN